MTYPKLIVFVYFEKKEIVLNIDKIFYGHVHRATEYMTMMIKMAKYINSIWHTQSKRISQAGRSLGYYRHIFFFLGLFQHRRLIRRLINFEYNVNAISAHLKYPRILCCHFFLEPMSFSVLSCTKLDKFLWALPKVWCIDFMHFHQQ